MEPDPHLKTAAHGDDQKDLVFDNVETTKMGIPIANPVIKTTEQQRLSGKKKT